MITYRVVVSADAKADLKRYIAYLQKKKRNPQAAGNVLDDFRQTRITLAHSAGAIGLPESEELQKRGLKRMNFLRHDYFLLYKVDGNLAIVTNIFHALEDFENKLK